MNGRILIVHAAGVMRMIVRENLQLGGYDVVGEAINGRQAVEKFRELHPDIVTMDMVLPELDGVSTVRAIISEFPEAIILMCSSVGQPAVVVEAINAGARSYIAKPFAPKKLIDTVKELLA
jgi:two-component system chemotaxis response regulator CheY